MPKKKTTIDDLAGMMQREFGRVNKRFDTVEAKMVTKKEAEEFATKDDLKETEGKLAKQIASLRGELIIIVRKEDKRLNALIELLRKRKLISEQDIKSFLNISVFPKIEVHG